MMVLNIKQIALNNKFQLQQSYKKIVLTIYFYNFMFFQKQTKQIHPQSYDQTSLTIDFQHGDTQLQEIRVSWKWASQQYKCRLPTLHCQWFNKTEQSMDLIEGVVEQHYQPSILDVDTIIYIQILPQSKELEYIGMPITKFIGPFRLSPQTEEQVKELIEAGKSTYFVQIKQIKFDEIKYSSLQAEQGIKDSLLKVVKNKILLMGKVGQSDKISTIKEIIINKEYPRLIIDRRSSKILTIYFSEKEKVLIQLQNNKIRDVLYLLIKQIRANTESEGKENQKVNQKKINIISQAQTQSQPQQQNQIKKVDLSTQQKQGGKIESTKIAQVEGSSSQDIDKKSMETLPLSPQTIQICKQQKEDSNKIKSNDLDNQNRNLQKLLQQTRQRSQNLQKQAKALKQSNQALTNTLKQLSSQKMKIQEEGCYFKNQCRIQQQDISTLRQQLKTQQLQIDDLTLKTSINLKDGSQKKYGKLLSLTYPMLLDLVMIKEQEIEQLRRKNNYQSQHSEQLQLELKEAGQKLEQSQSIISKLQRKIESLNQSKPAQELSSKHTHTHQIGSYEFQISKLKEEVNISDSRRRQQNQSKQKLINSLRVQVKELIEENTYLRSKEKSSKGELKNEIVQLKKLVNRFAESLSEKDIQIEHLKITNKELGKNLKSNQKPPDL